MEIVKVLSIVFPVFSIIGLGYLFASFRKISLEPIIDVLLYLTIPALVVSSLSHKKLVIADLAVVSLSALVVVLGTGVLAFLYLKAIKREDLRGFYLPAMFMNSGNMSFPLALLAFGPEGLSVAILYYIAISILVYSLGIYIAKGKGGLSEMFRLPLIYSAVLAIALNVAEVRMPEPLLTTFDMLGAATIPIMQVALGYRLYSARLAYPGISLAGTAIRIGGGVAVAWGVVSLFGIEGLNQQIILLSSGMPAAVINFVVSHRYQVNSDLVASTVALSTLVSVFTTPVLLLWIM
ncbi:MAG: AEC family transporter [Deltaproteobacteria bacterium]|nr:AEC family transporter [Deltaproteobacteria bacterium]MBZ0220595.1 AEC family transporter [Deltaproteobacteria bacterium]